MNNRDLEILQHIQRYCLEIEMAVNRFGDNEATFMKDPVYRNAASMPIQQIGELAKHYYHTMRNETDEQIWQKIVDRAGQTFRTARGLEFSYTIKRNKAGDLLGEMVIDRKEKTITRNTVLLAYEKARELMEREGCVSGPKKLGVFGASYLYPVFLELGVCKDKREDA